MHSIVIYGNYWIAANKRERDFLSSNCVTCSCIEVSREVSRDRCAVQYYYYYDVIVLWFRLGARARAFVVVYFSH